MKQHITLEQLNELNDKSELGIWCLRNEYFKHNVAYPISWTVISDTKTYETFTISPPLLSIGQMIEFLADGRDNDHMPEMTIKFTEFSSSSLLDYGLLFKHGNMKKKNGELCDRLWEAVKKVLNEQ